MQFHIPSPDAKGLMVALISIAWVVTMLIVAWGNSARMFIFGANLGGPLLLWLLVFRRLPVLLEVYEVGYRRGRRDSAELLREIGLQLDQWVDEDDEDGSVDGHGRAVR